MENMTKFERFMIKFVKAVKYFSVLCMGCGLALIIEYGFNFDFILLIGLATILFCCVYIGTKKDAEENEYIEEDIEEITQ